MKRSKYIDSTLLKADAAMEEIRKLCMDAREYDFAAVCVNPTYVSFAAELLRGSEVKVAAVAGFPLGQNKPEIKAFEARQCCEDGADEIDMVMNIARLKENDFDYVSREVALVKEAVGNAVLKVIIECCLLNEEEIVRACKAAVSGGADFVKTSTGFSVGGATVHDVKLMKETVGTMAKVKAAGGIRTKEDMDELLEAGADRIGTSNGAALL